MRAALHLSAHVVHYDQWDFGVSHVVYPNSLGSHDLMIHVGPWTIVIRW